MTNTVIRLEERMSAIKPLLARSNISRLLIHSLKLIKQNIGSFLAHAQVRQLPKNIDIKAKLDNAVD